MDGSGNGIVAVRADRLQEGTWVPPSSLHDASVLARPVGHLFNSVTNGIRTMPSYGPQIPVADRWAIVAYVRALQRSRYAPASVLTPEERAKLVEVAP
jgi:mono/diheme cytochrome c family protein